jgi:parallel beta-helix repeat protein
MPDSSIGIGLTSGMGDVSDCIINRNIIHGIGGSGIQVIQANGRKCEGVIVTNNNIKNVGRGGILVSGRNHQISDNKIENADRSGIEVSGSVGIILNGNTLVENKKFGIEIGPNQNNVLTGINYYFENVLGDLIRH